MGLEATANTRSLVARIAGLPVVKSHVYEDEDGKVWHKTWHRARSGDQVVILTRRLTGVGLASK